jgi:hypothetical protein
MLLDPEKKPRRVVATQGTDGRTHFVHDEVIEEDVLSAANGLPDQLFRIWATDRLPAELPWDGSGSPVDSDLAEADLSEILRHSTRVPFGPGQLRVHLVRHPANSQGRREPHLHWHDTVDIQWILDGEMTIGLDDGSEIVLGPLDAAVLYGANHSWRAGPQGALKAVFNLGASRIGPTPPPHQQRSDAPGHRTDPRPAS